MENITAKVEKGKLIIEAKLATKPELSSTGKSRILVSTKGFQAVAGDDGKVYGLNMNLVIK